MIASALTAASYSVPGVATGKTGIPGGSNVTNNINVTGSPTGATGIYAIQRGLTDAARRTKGVRTGMSWIKWKGDHSDSKQVVISVYPSIVRAEERIESIKIPGRSGEVILADRPGL